MKQKLLSALGLFLKWYLIIVSGLVATVIIVLVVGLSAILWYPKTAQYSLPYLADLTDGQLQIESAEGKLADGLTLRNIRFNNETINLHIAQVDWQWHLSSLMSRHAHLQTLNITQPTIQVISDDAPAETESALNLQPFELITQLEEYKLHFDIDQITITELSLQFGEEPAITIAEFKSGVHWQDQVLKIENLSTDYQTYQLMANSRFEVLNSAEFSADLNMKVLGIEGLEDLEPLSISTQASGSLEQARITLNMLAPYKMQTEHLLKLDANSIQLESEIKNLTAKLNEQWQIKQLQGSNTLSFNLESQAVVSKGQFKAELADKPAIDLTYDADYAKDGTVNFNLQTLLEKMGSLSVNGQANVQTLTANTHIKTHNLNLQWLDPELNYQINSLFDFNLSDFESRTSYLDIKKLDITGLPETFAFKGRVNIQLKNPAQKKAPQDYAITLKSGQLAYSEYAGQLNARAFISQDLKKIDLSALDLTLGDNTVHASGQWAEQLKLDVNANLKQLNQLYAPLSGSITAKLDSHGTLLKDLSGFEQAWSTIKVDANNLRYQAPDAINDEATTLNSLILNARIPLHKPIWSAFTVTAKDIQQTSDQSEALNLLSQLNIARQASGTGLETELNILHPDLAVHAELYEAKPNLKKQTITLKRFDIEQEETGNWRLDDPINIHWTAPKRIKTDDICLRSVNDKNAKLCLKAETDRAEWSMQNLPVLEWLKPFLTDTIVMKGRLSGQGSANWKNKLSAKQSLFIPQLDITVYEQGYEFPLLIQQWQTELQFNPSKATLTSVANVNETGRLNANIIVNNQKQQTWSKASLNGKTTLTLDQWQLSNDTSELLKFNKTLLSVNNTLSGTLESLQHDTRAYLDLNLNLPLLGLSDQVITLQAQVTPEVIEGSGVWIQHQHQVDERRADLSVTLSELSSQPTLLARFKTQSIELLKTPFANLKTSTNVTVTMKDNLTHIQGQAQLHDSKVNLDDMPIHQSTPTSNDEIIIDEQGQVVVKDDATSNLSYDITVGFGNNVEINVLDSQMLLGGELQLVQALNARDMKAFGEVKVRSGYLTLDERNRIQIDESAFIFSGNIENPTLNVNLFRVVDQTTARLNMTGNISQPQFVFYSTPALSQGRIINLMVFGRAGDMSKEPNYESQVLSALYKLGIQNNTPVLNTLTSALGIQDVYLDVEDQKVSSVFVGRALSDKLYVRYAKDLTGQQSNAVQFFYQLTNKWLLKTNSGDNNSSVDLIYRLERD